MLCGGIAIQKDELARRINRRVDEMVKGGLFDEVKKLLDSGVSTKLPAMSGIGYKKLQPTFAANFHAKKRLS